ncbi:XrtA system polysaccharide chain length determinant [Sediminicurvatus halobius]|uniref:Chain length-determining protein n=1 Tax=Sediminicurvatus halobius TaxID=2182432 RepID=A0A2U2N0C9_9GAMM|nr:XrtA system polysaccharide chain length determinant [Spiribacter halobius]PWG62691.1 hypothetical protein DEM34_11100 [Spiribacter halobius]UEX77360.1 lipopolysaccharide biosynthesis protein [Spiribacter halobius]
MHELVQLVLDLARNTWRFKWIALLLAWPIALGGWAWVAQQPDEYRASTRVYVDTRSLLQPLMSGLSIMPNVSEQLDMVNRTLLSRPNLEQVARDSDLDLQANTDAELEQVVAELERRIDFRGSPRDNLYTIAYRDQDPQRARSVVQSLLDIFVETSLGGARSDLGSSRAFIESQVEAYEQRIDELDQRISEFEREHHGLLPGSGPDYYARVKENEARLEEARLELEEAVERRNTFQQRLQQMETENVEPPPDGAQQRLADLESRINEMERSLDQMLLRYTEEHPDVIATRRVLGDLEQRRDELLAQVGGGESDEERDQFAYRSQLEFALAEAESRVASLRARVQEFEQRQQQLEDAVARIPQIEAEYKELTRNYDIVQRNYDTLRERRELARLTGEVQVGTDTVEFRVVDPPFVPSNPVSPDRFVLSSAVLFLALGAGGGAAFGLGQLRPAVVSRAALERLTERPYLGAVSINPTPQHRRRTILKLGGFLLAVAALLGVYAGVVTLPVLG